MLTKRHLSCLRDKGQGLKLTPGGDLCIGLLCVFSGKKHKMAALTFMPAISHQSWGIDERNRMLLCWWVCTVSVHIFNNNSYLMHFSICAVSFNRNWCAYVVMKSVSCVMEDGVETYVKPDYQPCGWGQCSRVVV